MKNIYLKIRELAKKEGRLVLATVIATRGSTPQKAGSSALFSKRGLVFGTIGGGILEGKVQKIAMESVLTGNTAIHQFELDKDISYKEEAICGGQATVLIDAGLEKHPALFSEVEGSLQKRVPCILSTLVTINDKGIPLVERFFVTENVYSKLPSEILPQIRNEASKILTSDSGRGSFSKIDYGKAGEKDSGCVMLESLFPPLQLVIAGAGHIGRSLCRIGKLLDFEVTLIDDRSEFANPLNIPEADHFFVEDIGKSMASLPKTPDTYIVIVTRGHNDDAMALKHCIGSRAAYVGMIGSRTKIEKMHRNFVESGLATEEQWSVIHAPIGIEINSKTVEEIAISIAAELVMVRNRGK
jgi:xanthine dehydrogenase accessory factor